MIQGNPLAMVAYGIIILPLIKHFNSTYPHVTQSCYADNAGELCMLNNLKNYFKALKCNGLERGYYPDPTKSILVVHPQNLEFGVEFRQRHGFKVCTGARYD